jgi:hypothetical protein
MKGHDFITAERMTMFKEKVVQKALGLLRSGNTSEAVGLLKSAGSSKEQIDRFIELVSNPDMAKHGGVRPRSGRKPIPEEDRRVAVSCRVTQETRKRLEGLSDEMDLSFGEVLDKIVPSVEEYLRTDTKKGGG